MSTTRHHMHRSCTMSFRRAAWFWLAVCATLIASTAAHAKDVRYVGVGGDDANPCTRLAPCRTLQRGLDVTSSGGEVKVLTSGNNAPVTITRSVTVSAEGVSATVEGVVINGADAVVTLRGLAVHGKGRLFVIGVETVAAAAVHIERCEIWGLDHGVLHNADGDLFINDSIVRNNRYVGVRAHSASSRVVIDNTRLVSNGNGVELYNADVAITRSLVSGNRLGVLLGRGGAVAHVDSTTSTSNGLGYRISRGTLTLQSSTAGLTFQNSNLDTGPGVRVDNQATLRISNATVTDNPKGIDNQGTALTRRNNTISGNKTDLVGNPLTPIGGQ